MQKALRPVGLRLRAQRAMRWGGHALAGGAAVALLYGGAAFLWPLAHALAYGFACCFGASMLGACVGWLWPVSPRWAAKRADACGLKARIQTAQELEDEPETPMSLLQRADALQALEGLDARRSIETKPHGVSVIVACACMLLAVGLAFVPNPQHEVLRAKDAFRTEMRKQAERLEKGAAGMEKQDDQAAMEARKLLGELSRELRSSNDPREALEAIDQAARKMEKLRQQEADNLRQALSQSGLDALAEAVQSQDGEAMREALQQANPASLTQAAAQTMGSPAQALQAAANAMAAGNLAQAINALLGAGNLSSVSQGTALLQGAQLSAAQAGQSLGMPTAGGAAQALAALGAQSGNQSGQGSGLSAAGQGGGGSGAGQGSTNQDAGYTSNQGRSSGGGGRAPQVKIGEYETIYDPTRIGGDGEVAQERGVIGEGDISELTLGGGAGSLGDNVPYADVALEYQESAVQSVQNANLPAYAQKWVESYFQSLLD